MSIAGPETTLRVVDFNRMSLRQTSPVQRGGDPRIFSENFTKNFLMLEQLKMMFKLDGLVPLLL